MKLRILDETGDTVLTDEPKTEGTDRVKLMTKAEIKKEFDKLVKKGFTPINDKTNRIVDKINKTDSVTMLYPIIGG